MSNSTYKGMDFQLDNASGTLTSIKSYLNQQDLKRVLDLIEDTAMGSAERTFQNGLGANTLTVNGMINSTTDAIFSPLVAATTSVTKTFQWKKYTGKYFNGETLLTGIQYSGKTNSLQTFSANLTVTGAINQTSVALT